MKTSKPYKIRYSGYSSNQNDQAQDQQCPECLKYVSHHGLQNHMDLYCGKLYNNDHKNRNIIE
jgi:hypothetical protein